MNEDWCIDWRLGSAIRNRLQFSLSKKGVDRWRYENSSVVNTFHRFKSSPTGSGFNQSAAWKTRRFGFPANGSEWNSSVGGATTSPCQVVPFVSSGNRWRRWRGGHPAQIWRGVGTNGGVQTSFQSWLSNDEPGEGLAVPTSLRNSHRHCWILVFFTLVLYWRPSKPRARFGDAPGRVQEDVCGIVWKVSCNAFAIINLFEVVTYSLCWLNCVYATTGSGINAG